MDRVRIARAPLASAIVAAMALIFVACQQQQTSDPSRPHEGQRSSGLGGGGIQFVQQAYATPQSSPTTVSVKYTAAQGAGDLNVVAVGWNDTSAAVTSVTDTLGNAYSLAVGPTTFPGALSQAIYYAPNILAAGAGANTVKVTFNRGASFPDVRILEYSGIISTSPLDVTAAASGTGTTADSGGATTTNANDLLFGANMTTGSTSGPGTGFTSRVITWPDGDIAEDQVVSTTGAYHATAGMDGSPWVMQMAAFRSQPADSQPPTAPGSLGATAITSARIDLSWSASTDNVGITGYLIERCTGPSCSSFAQIAAPAGTGTTYSDTGLTPNTSYSYRVRAKDGAGNLSPYSNVASATTLPDTQPPTAPSNLGATAFSGNRIDLSWTAATDNVGVTGYLIERCTGGGCSNFAQIAAPAGTGTTFSDPTVSSGISYSYQVRATDAAGNLGPYSNVASATTPAPDTQPATAPSGLTATGVSNAQINLSWTASTDNVAVTGYLIERCTGSGCLNFTQVGTTTGTGTTYSDSGLATSTTYSYQIRATDAAGNLSGYSNVASGTTLSTAPIQPIPGYVQSNYATPQATKSSVTIPFTGAQRAGDLNVVVVGWNDSTARVTSVTDTKGNAYSLAIGPTQVAGSLSQSIYYATNIAGATAGANTVTVAFSPAAAYPDIRILEYRGVAHTNPLDGAIAATGSGSTTSTGPITTSNPIDLLVGANTITSLASAPGAGFTLRMITSPDGDLAEDRVTATAGSYSATAALSYSGDWAMQLVAFKAAPPDGTPPNVSVSSPSSGAALTGTITVTVNADDPDTGLQAIQLLVDGAPVGLIAPTSPGSFSLNTAQFANGTHAISASALNGVRAAGYAAPVTVTFGNASPGNPVATGLWSGLISLPIVSVHLALLPNSKVLMNDGQSLGGDARTWDTLTNSFNSVPVPANIFCTAHEQMADGRIFTAGGHNGGAHLGLPVANIFDPATETWTALPNMSFPRWYPTTTELPDGRQLVLAGESNCPECEVLIPEVYNPATNTWTKLTSASFSFTYYPQVFVQSDGRVLVAGTSESPTASQILNVSAQTWTPVGGPATEGGSAAMYRPGKIVKAGKSVDPDETATPSVSTAYVLDMTQATPTWRQVGSMAFARTYHTLTLLPDGTVLATGGGPTTAATDTAHAIMQAELWSPNTETWTTLASMHAPRLYHSEAVLLPDGRVVVLGGGRFDDDTLPTDQFNAEFFTPPYLFKGPRPVIVSAPSTLSFGQGFTIQTPDAARIASVALLRFGAVTHALNMGQRYVPLSFTVGSGSLNVTAPANSNVATPGNYMLFLVDTNGVPSVAAQVRL
jgi:chitodextrinase